MDKSGWLIKLDKADLELTTKEWVDKKDEEGWYVFREVKRLYHYSNPKKLLLEWISESEVAERAGRVLTEYDIIRNYVVSDSFKSITHLEVHIKGNCVMAGEIYIGKNHIGIAYIDIASDCE